MRDWLPGLFSKGRHLGVLACLGVLAGASSACYGPVLKQGGDLVERTNAAVASRHYKALATIAGGGGSHIDLQVSVTVREQLSDSGFTVVRRAGRWSDERSAVRAICAPDAVPPVDGVVFVWYDRLELRDCQSEVVAYEVSGTADQGLTAMTDRLIGYLKQRPGGAAATTRPANPAAAPEQTNTADTTDPAQPEE